MNRLAAAAALGLACAMTAGSASQAPQQPPPKFRAGVNLVVVDVSVLDANRVPVRGLTAADFTVLEDGKPQPIATFSAIDLPDVEVPTATWMKDVAPDIQRNVDQAERRLMVIVLDDATPMLAEDVPQVRQMARRVVDRLGPADLAAVVYVLNKKQGQEFTSDRTRLLAALDHFNGGMPSYPVSWDVFDAKVLTMYRSTIGTLQGVTDSLIDLPGRRKALVFISVGLPLDVESVAPAEMGEGTSYVGDVARDLIKEVFELFRAAQRANVNVYSVDPGGLRAPATVVNALAGTGTLIPNPGRLNRDFLQAVSENTGGVAVVNTNDPEPGIVQMFRENGSYYLLGYEAPNPQSAGKYRQIDIRVNRPGVTVRARRGYFEPRRAAVAKAGSKPVEPPSPVLSAISSVVPKTDIALTATAAPIAATGRDRTAVAVAVQLELSRPEITASVADQIDVQMTAYDASGRPGGSETVKVGLTLRPEVTGDLVYEALGRLDLKPGRYQLRLGAASSLQKKSGSVYYDLDVPDFSKGPLAVSGAVLSATLGPVSGPKERLATLLPVLPTSRREFWPDDKVTAFLRVHEGGREPLAAVIIDATILDGRGTEVFSASDVLEPDRFANSRAADYQLALPLTELKAGPYLLTLETSLAGKPAGGPARLIRRDIRFSIR